MRRDGHNFLFCNTVYKVEKILRENKIDCF